MAGGLDSIRAAFGEAVCADNAPMDQSMGRPLNRDFKGTLSTLAKGHDVVVLGDTNHEDLGTKWFVENGVVETLAGQGVKKLYLEMDPNDQKKINALTKGEMSPQKFTDEVSSRYVGGEDDLTNIILQAKKNKMEVIAADNPEAGKSAQLAGKYQLMADMLGTDTPEGKEYLDKAHDHLKQRMDKDVDLANMVNTTRGDEKAAIIMGANHGRTENGLMENLRGSAAKIDVYG
jgi:hypothetical protein